ncbi:MAG: hypothetical protein BroJett011_70290 [Chloroflexota bacterium]|nr:MAG: hypothetical protein BroJett011_70290 [Chloroflexota bacterium]
MIKKQYRPAIFIVVSYILLTIILTYPVAFRLTSHIAGFPGEDNLQWRWFLWWFKHSLLNLQTSVSHVSVLFAPTGGDQPLYAVTTYVPALALPLTLLGGPTLSFNLSVLLSFAFSGYTAYLLAYYLTRRRWAAFVGGLIFAFFPARFGYATGTFLAQLTTYFLPVYLLALFVLARQPSLRRAVWTAVTLAILCLTWPLHVVYGVVALTLPFLICQGLIWLRRPEKRGSLKYFGLAFGLAFALLLGFYWPLLSSMLRGDHAHLGGKDTIYFAADLLAFAAPSNYHPVLQPLHLLPQYATRILADRDDIQERLVYIGLTPLVLVGLGLLKFRGRLAFWLLTALAAMFLSLGPLLKFNGSLVQLDIEGYVGYVVLPYALLRSIPVLDWSPVLGRLNVTTMLCVAMMASYGVTALLSGRKRAWRPALVLVLAGLILFEFWTIFPFPTEPDKVPEFYYRLKQEAAARPQMIIDLPLPGEPAYNNYSMHYQTVHEQPLAGGHLMREPAGAHEMLAFLNQLLLPPPDQPVIALPGTQARLGLLNKFGFTKITARLPLMTNAAAQSQLTYLSTWLGQPRPEGEVAVFEIPPGGDPPHAVSLLGGDGWQTAENTAGLEIRSPAELLVYLDEGQGRSLRLHLAVFAPQSSGRYLTVNLDGRPLARLYLQQETLTYQLPLSLGPGAHQFTFYPEELCQQECAPVIFSRIAVEPYALAENEAQRQSIVFGQRLALLDNNISSLTAQPGQPILVYLYWQSTQKMAADYSAFVHLVSPAGELVSQTDYLLGDWLYPTSQWPPGQILAMPSLFFIPPDAKAGGYQLRAGVYNAETKERLFLSDHAGQPDFILLSSITVKPE